MRCPACGGPLVNDLQRGEVVCAQCGLVVSESIIDTGPEWRVYKPEDVKRVRAAPLKLVIKTDIAARPEPACGGAGWRGYTEKLYTAARGGWLKSGLS